MHTPSLTDEQELSTHLVAEGDARAFRVALTEDIKVDVTPKNLMYA